ncbi:MAG: sterol desaturase family protein [Bdellovibrionota bacterium]
MILGAFSGFLAVEFGGYAFHRYVKHAGVFGDDTRRSHWLHHEVEYPIEKLRAGKDHVTTPISVSWWFLGAFFSGIVFLPIPLAFSAAFVIGGWAYGLIFITWFHAAFHDETHWLHKKRWFQRLRYLHDLHHWKQCNYGIVFFFMDRTFGTYSDRMPKVKEDNFPGLEASTTQEAAQN